MALSIECGSTATPNRRIGLRYSGDRRLQRRHRSGGLVVLDRLAVEPDTRIWRKTPSMPSRSVSMMRRKDRTRSQR